jgi:hypothetical protein
MGSCYTKVDLNIAKRKVSSDQVVLSVVGPAREFNLPEVVYGSDRGEHLGIKREGIRCVKFRNR